MSKPPSPSALSHLRVLDLTRVRAGPTCCRILADFGADVIKVEAPAGVDPNEGISGERLGYDMQNLHRNKRSLTLNLKRPEGHAIFMDLVKGADAKSGSARRALPNCVTVKSSKGQDRIVSTGTVRLETAGPIARIVLDNPARHNAMSLDMWRLLPGRVSHAVADRRVRVIAVIGAGEKAFCAGADISEFGTNRADPDAAAAYNEAVKVALTALRGAEKPTVAQIRGICFGGGLEIALCCDLRAASSSARFRIPAARLGLGYGYDDVSLLVERLGVGATAEILFTASIIEADHAVARGIVHTVFADEAFTEDAERYLGVIAANAPLVLKAVKRALIELEKPKHERDVAAVETAAAACIESRDYLEGQAAFRERREPRFMGE